MAKRRPSIFETAPEPCDSLARRIMLHIEQHEQRVLRAKAAIFGAVFTGSFSVAIASFVNFGSQVSHSGFLSFASLWFSDFSTALANLPDMLSSMLESFPALSAALLLGGVAFAVWSAGKLISEIGMMRKMQLSN
jgi:hypothetical protein